MGGGWRETVGIGKYGKKSRNLYKPEGGSVMKKVISILLSIAMILAFCAGCGGNTAPASSAAPAASALPAESKDAAPSGESVKITLGHIYNPNHNEAIALEKLKELLAEKSNGRIELVIYPSSQMGSEREMAEQVMLGTLDMGLSDGPTWSNALQVPEIAVFGLPFLYKDIDGQKAVINEILIDSAGEMMIGKGVRPLFGFSASIRGAILATKPIVTAADIDGVKMRVPEITMYVDTWRCLGANPTTTPWGEAYTSIAQGVVDGAEVDPSTIVDANLQEVTKYFSKTAHMGTIHIVSMNEAKWQSIPEDLRKIFLECAAEASAWQIEDRKTTDEAAVQKMVDAGVTVNEVSDEERAKMAERCKPIYDQYDADYGLGDLISQLQEIGG
ncbi:TRAP transporter substrate-binding protein [Anaerotruncus sp. AF02-27]|jgi:tripartite ATP-independent transporter DctP family solute receptor|nr:TRAP transporter substrate-binding protein [Anaerotruncus sp. AF02-27]